MYNKAEEFQAWLVKEQKINPEMQLHKSSKKEFAQFMEDYNTSPYLCSSHANGNEHANMSSNIVTQKVLQH